MKPARTPWWWIFGAGALAAAAALAWVTREVLALEQAEARARHEMQRQEALGLALWQMDSWLSPLFAREATRPYFHYQAFFAQARAYTRLLGGIEPGEVLTPSPLLCFRSEYLRLHFQVGPEGWTSPQLPTGNLRDLAETSCDPLPDFEANRGVLDGLASALEWTQVQAEVARREARVRSLTGEEPAAGAGPMPEAAVDESVAARAAEAQLRARAQNIYPTKQALEDQALEPATADGEPVRVGPLVPMWLDGDRLLFLRRVGMAQEVAIQGFLCDWPHIESALLELIRDQLPGASLRPAAEGVDPSRSAYRLLATVPAILEVPDDPLGPLPAFTPVRATLLMSWLAVAAAFLAGGFTLHSSIRFGERRSRFASAVTHELRTPLTTFRMYAEMLADGMVSAPEQRQHYLETLRSESERLSRLVENVLTYSRLEEGRATTRAERTSVLRFVEGARSLLEQRCADAGLRLELEADAADRELDLDADAAGQILFNLVDNACKYAAGSAPAAIRLIARAQGSWAELRVQDHGPGISRSHARAIFAPFDRGAVPSGDTIPGVGLGLALSRRLARDLGGDLLLEEREEGQGASFLLRLPLRS